MSTTALTEILKSDDLDMDEKDILATVKEWATVNSVRDSPFSVQFLYILCSCETTMIFYRRQNQ